MRAQRLLFLSFFALLFLFFGIQKQTVQADTPIYKQLAAAPDEMASLRLPDVAELGLRSHSAMIAVELVNGSWQGELLVESAETIKLMALNSDANWSMTMQSPSGATLDLTPASRSAAVTSFGSGNSSYPGVLYTLNDLESGVWQVSLTGDASRSSEQGVLLYANPEAEVKLYSHLTSYDLLVGNTIGLRAYAFANTAAEEGAPATNGVAFDSAEIAITQPDGTTIIRNGTLAADGAYDFAWQATMAGDHTAQVRVVGSNNGEPFQRTSEHLFAVVSESVQLAAQADTVVANAQRLQIDLAVADAQASSFLVSAELWGTQNGSAVPVAWIGGINDVVSNSLPVTVDGRWIARANASAPFSLRNVVLKDVDSSVPVASIAAIALDVAELPASASVRSAAITDDMLMGVRPPAENVDRAPGGKLMLVHGYCSSDVWNSSQFTNDIKFQDFNQNRSHNEFAIRIRDFGASYPSFNIVAHSQGGAASLHLYTYYWSGLDYATTSRLVQSVGTPYQGTSLAGNLALLGQIFGVGCGSNTDLTYSGAASWLSGIPNWARDDIYFATTSFTDKWWRYDYCNFASDLVLSDPDDGTTERAKGQLSGGNNMGHKTGWCHTSGMRDPAQTTDSSRNAMMNSYGDRDAGATTPKIVIDGIFDDWQDNGGLEYCLNGTGSLSAACIASDQFTHLYFLTTAASSAGSVCSELDTDGDSFANYQACYAADNSAEFVTLYSCSDNATACADAAAVATYPTSGFNAASSTIEFGIGLNDLGVALGDSVCWSAHAATDALPSATERACYNTATGEVSTTPTDPTAVTQVTQSAGSQSVALIAALTLSLLGFSFVALRRND